ncbi:cytochrome c biogenesis protein [Streptomyces gelaticus]|uniref:Cytochrome c biogenesis protein n=1 Tax=Streptomyces gelaticus TaxID=285446 RepID=A0ABQ2W5Q9_9ACTN|nr:TlpA disulfide reductase family protein [Streptomyces gelaticus]GGV89577.1 cytochrome c biogenesis protein [Streptomyces gelaticus]
MKRPLVPFLAALACAVALIVGISIGGSPGTPTGFHRGKDGTLTIDSAHRPAAPDLTGTDVDGRPVRLADYAGKTVVVNAWASWCESCREETPVLVRYHQKMKDQGVVVLGLNRDGTANAARAFAREFHMPYPSVLDPGGKHLLSLPKGVLSTQKLPVTLVVDERGRVAASMSGAVKEGRLEGLVAAARAGSPAKR